MDEAILIDIAKRRRALEDACEAADLFLISFKERCERIISKADAAHASGDITFGTYCNRVNEPEADLKKLEEVRGDIDKSLEACRDDMNRLMDEIRKAKACA